MNVAFIPVRGGSKSIPLKNIKMISGKPLVYWTIKAACECSKIDKVYVATDHDEIRRIVNSFKEKTFLKKLVVIERSDENASDTASTESAMLEFATKFNFKNIVLIQATSPLLTSDDLNAGFDVFSQNDCDSVMSAVRQNRFCWKINDDGTASPLNYDVYNRPRRQDFSGYMVENGAFYITSRELLISTGNRISGRIKIVEMCKESFFEIDEPSDWTIVESFIDNTIISKNESECAIKMFLTDCDGCLTDGGMYYSENGDELKKFNTKDGMAFSILREKGILTGVITGENRNLNKRRFKKLNVDILEQGCRNKANVIKDISKKYNISLNNILYVGDDINDIDAMKIVGFACCPYDAEERVKEISKYVSSKKGGAGVIRDIVDNIERFI